MRALEVERTYCWARTWALWMPVCIVSDLTTLSQHRLTFSGSLLRTVFTSTWIDPVGKCSRKTQPNLGRWDGEWTQGRSPRRSKIPAKKWRMSFLGGVGEWWGQEIQIISKENTAGQRSRELGMFMGLKEDQVFQSTRSTVIGDDLGEPSQSYAMDLGLYVKGLGWLD